MRLLFVYVQCRVQSEIVIGVCTVQSEIVIGVRAVHSAEWDFYWCVYSAEWDCYWCVYTAECRVRLLFLCVHCASCAFNWINKRHFWSYLAEFYWEWGVSDFWANQNTIFCSVTFYRKSCREWDNVEIHCRAIQATDENRALAHCMLGT